MTTTNQPTEVSADQAEAVKALIEAGRVPLKLVLGGTQTSQGIKFEAGSVTVAEGATAIFVCG